jgi:hypothetical protein
MYLDFLAKKRKGEKNFFIGNYHGIVSSAQ